MLTFEEKKRLEEISWAVLYADISYSSLLRRMLHVHGSLKECPKNIKDAYVAVQEARRMMSKIIKDYNLGSNGSDVALLNLSAEEMYPIKSRATRDGKK